MGRAILGAIVAAIFMFGWGYLAWTPVLELHEMKGFAKSDAVATALQESGDDTGVYWIPAPPPDMDEESEAYKEWEGKLEAGPHAMVVYRSDGAKAGDLLLTAMLKGFAVQLVACLLLAFLLLGAKVTSFFGRWIFTITVGLILTIWADGMSWAFAYSPDEWTIRMAIDHAIAFAIAGLVLALIVRPKA